MCFHEIEPYADVILVNFQMSQGVNTAALANIITGQTEPSASTGVARSPMSAPRPMAPRP